MRITINLKKKDKKWSDFLDEVKAEIGLMPSDIRYEGVLLGYLEPINKSELFANVLTILTDIKDTIKLDHKPVVCVEFTKTNYNHNHLKERYSIKLSAYQENYATATTYHEYKYANVDIEAQEREFNEKIAEFSEGEKAYYRECFDNGDLLSRNFEHINSEQIIIAQDFKHNIDLEFIDGVYDLKREIKSLLESSDEKQIADLFTFENMYTNNSGFGLDLCLFGEKEEFKVEYKKSFK